MAICNDFGDLPYLKHAVRGVSDKAIEECIKRSFEVAPLYIPPEVIDHGTQRFSCSKPNLQQIPKSVCPDCKGEGEIECENCGGTGETMRMVCYGDMPTEKIEECEECDDGMIKCPKCEGGKEMSIDSINCEDWNNYGKHESFNPTKVTLKKPMSRSGVRLLTDKIGGADITTYDDFTNFVICMLKNNRRIYKSHLIMAIVEKYYFTCDELKSLVESLDFSKGKGRYCYDKVDDKIYDLISKGILEPWTKGEVLKLRIRSSEFTTIKCPDCKGEGTVSCPNDELDCPDICPDNSPGCNIKCPMCKGEGTVSATPVLGGIVEPKNMMGDSLSNAVWVEEASSMTKDQLDSLILMIRRKKTRKKYEINNEELHIKRGKSTRKKYEIREGDLK